LLGNICYYFVLEAFFWFIVGAESKSHYSNFLFNVCGELLGEYDQELF